MRPRAGFEAKQLRSLNSAAGRYRSIAGGICEQKLPVPCAKKKARLIKAGSPKVPCYY